MRSIALPTMLFLVSLDPANAATVDGHQLLDWTHSQERSEFAKDKTGKQFADDVAATQRFLGYVQGVIDAENNRNFCVPNEVETWRLVDLVETWVDVHSADQLNQRGDIIVVLALRGDYPCSR